MRKLFKYCIGLLTVFTLQHADAQELFPIHLDYQKGLSSNIIYNLAQDPKGFIWMVGNEGLFRYDGFRSVAYKSADQTSTAGSVVKIDRYGRVWYENFDGFLYYVEGDSLRSLPQNTPVGYMPYGLTDKFLFVAQKKGIDVYDLRKLKLIKTISIGIDIPEHATTNGNSFYFIADNILYKISEDLVVSRSSYFANKNWKVKYIYPFRDKLYVVSKFNEEKQLYFFDEHLNFERSIPIPEVKHIQGSDVADNQIMIHTSRGVYTYTEHGKLLFSKDGQFKSMSVSAVIRDYQNNYWVSSINRGVCIIPGLQNRIYPLEGKEPLRIVKNRDGYLMGTQDGALLQLNDSLKISGELARNDESLPVYYIDYNPIDDYTVYSAKGFSCFSQKSVAQETNYNVALKKIVRLDERYAAYAASGFCGLFLNPRGAAKGASPWDSLYRGKRSEKLPNTARLINGVRGKSVDYNPKTQEIAFATNLGLYLQTPGSAREVLNQGKPFYATEVVWIGDTLFALDTKGTLFKLSKDRQFIRLNEELDISPSDIKRIKKFGDTILILSSKYIYSYKPASGLLIQTAFNFGIQSIRDIIKVDDLLIVLTREGVVKIRESDSQKRILPRFYINALYANRGKLANGERLSYRQNNVHVDFSVLEYSGQQTPVYYRINQREWISVNNFTRDLEFPALAPGEYSVEFKIGEQVSKEIVRFEIAPPYWKAWWFYISLSALAGLLLISYFKWQARLMKNQIRLLNEKVNLEKSLSKSVLTSIKSQMNPHFFYNALNTIQAYIFTNDRMKASSYLAKFSKLTRLVLEMSERDRISLTEEVESLHLYLELEKMRFQDSFSFQIITDGITDKEGIEFPPMLIQPYVENAVKHGLLHREQEKNVRIGFVLRGDLLEVTIDDNGIGRKRSGELNRIKTEKHQSFSTSANGKRLEILSGGGKCRVAVDIIDKYTDDGVATGTKVVLLIPLN